MRDLIKFFSNVLLLIVLSTISIFSQKQFEGKVNIKFTDKDGTRLMDYLLKENKTRMEWKDNKGKVESAIITDKPAMKVFILMPKNKSYIEHTIEITKEDEKEVIEKTIKKMQFTNERKNINGFNCQKVILKGEENVETWVTKDIKGFSLNQGPNGGANMPEWYSEIANAGYFTILAIDKDKNGKEESRLEVTSVEKKNIR